MSADWGQVKNKFAYFESLCSLEQIRCSLGQVRCICIRISRTLFFEQNYRGLVVEGVVKADEFDTLLIKDLPLFKRSKVAELCCYSLV